MQISVPKQLRLDTYAAARTLNVGAENEITLSVLVLWYQVATDYLNLTRLSLRQIQITPIFKERKTKNPADCLGHAGLSMLLLLWRKYLLLT